MSTLVSIGNALWGIYNSDSKRLVTDRLINVCKTHLGQEPVHIDGLNLTKAIDPEDTLDVIGRIPRGIENDDPVGCH